MKATRILATAGLGLGLTLGVPVLSSTASAAPVLAAYGPTTGPSITVSPTVVAPGGTVTITCTGFDPGETVIIVLHTDPVTLGTATADPSGDVHTTVTIPTNTTPGQHTITVTGETSGLTLSATITVEGAVTAAAAPSSSLPFTGANVAATTGVGAGAVAIGGGLVLAARKRRRHNFS